MNTSRLTRNSFPRQVAYIPLVPESSFLVVRVNVYEVHTDCMAQSPTMRCSDSVAPERYRSSKGRYTVYDGMLSEQYNLAGRRDEPLFLVWAQLDAFALGNLTLQRQLCNSFVDGRAYPFDALEGSTYGTRIDERTLEVVE